MDVLVFLKPVCYKSLVLFGNKLAVAAICTAWRLIMIPVRVILYLDQVHGGSTQLLTG